MEESLAAMKAGDRPAVAKFGHTTTMDRVGFRQLVIAKDRSAVILALLLPKEMAESLKPGTYPLGGTTLQPVEQGSLDGWASQCPDKEENQPLVLLEHYAVPGKNALPMPGGMVPEGDLARIYQTHHTRIRRDTATLEIKRLDRAAKMVAGVLKGEASWIVPKDPDAANSRKPATWMCQPGEYTVKTEPFEASFTLHLDRM